MMRHTPHSPRAFTLVEALAVVAVMGIVMPVIMYGISLSSSAAILVKQRSEAAAVARNKLAEIIVTNQWQNAGLSGDVGESPRVYHWTTRVQDWQELTLHEVAVEVTWTSRGQSRSLLLSTLVYDGGNTSQ